MGIHSSAVAIANQLPPSNLIITSRPLLLQSSSRSPTCNLQPHHLSETLFSPVEMVAGTPFGIPCHMLPPTHSSVPTLLFHLVGLFPATSHRTVSVNWHRWGLSAGWCFNSLWLLKRGEPIITTTNDFTPLAPMMCFEPNHREAQKGRSGEIGAQTKEASPLFGDVRLKKRKMYCNAQHSWQPAPPRSLKLMFHFKASLVQHWNCTCRL